MHYNSQQTTLTQYGLANGVQTGGYVNESQPLPIDIEIDKETVSLRPGDSTEIKVPINRVDTVLDRNNRWTMLDSATIKENGSLNGTGSTDRFSQESFT